MARALSKVPPVFFGSFFPGELFIVEKLRELDIPAIIALYLEPPVLKGVQVTGLVLEVISECSDKSLLAVD